MSGFRILQSQDKFLGSVHIMGPSNERRVRGTRGSQSTEPASDSRARSSAVAGGHEGGVESFSALSRHWATNSGTIVFRSFSSQFLRMYTLLPLHIILSFFHGARATSNGAMATGKHGTGCTTSIVRFVSNMPVHFVHCRICSQGGPTRVWRTRTRFA